MRRASGLLQYMLGLIGLYLVLRYGGKAALIINALFTGGVKLARQLQARD